MHFYVIATPTGRKPSRADFDGRMKLYNRKTDDWNTKGIMLEKNRRLELQRNYARQKLMSTGAGPSSNASC